jgi:peptide/nickel transport system substrate-binding protein
MKLRDRALVGILSVALVGLSVIALAPTIRSSAGPAEPTPNAIDTRHYVEGVLGRASNASPFGARSAAERSLVSLLVRGLVRLGPGSTVSGDLALSWEADDAGRTWTFHLRDGQFWEDGEPITAADVAFTVGVLSDPAYTGPGAESWRDVSATVVDRLTVVLELSTPLGGFLQAATQPIAPAHVLGDVPIEAISDDPFGKHPVGSGPFRLSFLITGRALLTATAPIEALPEEDGGPNLGTPPPHDSLASARPTPKPDMAIPYLSQMELRYYDDLDALEADWAAGDLDAASGLQPADAVELARSAGARLVQYPGTTLLAATLNLRAGETDFGDYVVRRAMLHAIDRGALVRDVLDGLGEPADSLIPPSSAMFDAEGNTPIAYDPDVAREALAKAGWKLRDGVWVAKGGDTPLAIEVLSPEELANPVAYRTAQAVVDAWHEIGLAAQHVPLPAAELVGDRLVRGLFQVAIVPLAIGLDPDVYPLLASSQTRTGGSNFSGLQDAALDKLLVAARTPVDQAQRAVAYAALQARLESQEYILPLAFRDEYVVFRDTVTGPESRPVGAVGDRYWDVLVWRLADGS